MHPIHTPHHEKITWTKEPLVPIWHYNLMSSHHQVSVNNDNPMNITIGKCSTVINPPCWTIRRNSAGYKTFDEFCNSIKSPGLSKKKQTLKIANGAVISQEEFQGNLKSLPEIATLLDQDEYLQGAETPKITASITYLLNKAMGINTNNSPANTVLSKVSTAPPSDNRSRKDLSFYFDGEINSKDEEKPDHPEKETKKGDWEEQWAMD